MKTTWTLIAGALALASIGCAGGAAERAPAALSEEVSLRVRDTDGEARDLDAALSRGETVAFVFWQTWCESCAEEAPAIQAAAGQERGKIHFVGVVPGKVETVDEAEVAEVRARWGYGFPQLRDADMSLSRALEVKGTPTIVVLGRGREVLYHAHRPPADWSTLRGRAFADVDAGSPPRGGGPGAECEDGVCPLPADE